MKVPSDVFIEKSLSHFISILFFVIVYLYIYEQYIYIICTKHIICLDFYILNIYLYTLYKQGYIVFYKFYASSATSVVSFTKINAKQAISIINGGRKIYLYCVLCIYGKKKYA